MEDFTDLLGGEQQSLVPAQPTSEEFSPGTSIAPSGKPHPVDQWANPDELMKWMKKMRHVPTEGIDDKIVHDTYAAAVWKLRECALAGDYTGTRAMELFLKWAAGVIARPKRDEKNVSPGSASFGAREPETGDDGKVPPA